MKKIHQSYKEMQRKSWEQGHLLPEILSPIHIPPKHRLTLEEINKLDYDTMKLAQQYRERLMEERKILKGESIHATLTDLYEAELKNWLEKFPEYKDIIR